jgi:hypothetical protein
MVLAAVAYKVTPKQEIQAKVTVRVYYAGEETGELTQAIVYHDKDGKMDRKKAFEVPANKSLVPGLRHFWVQPRDAKKRPLGKPERVGVTWPSQEPAELEIPVRRNKTRAEVAAESATVKR